MAKKAKGGKSAGVLAASSSATSSGRRLVVGYLSTDIGEHPTSHLMRSFWRLQREGGRVRSVCFARSDDGSAQRAYIASTCDEFVDLSRMHWRAAADAIRSRRVMILVDLNGHCGRPQFEILSLRPAPIQMSYMGHPGTSGAPYVQYVLTDRTSAPPRARSHFTEHFLSLHQWHVTDYRFSNAFERLGRPPIGAPPAGAPLPWPEEARRDALGLPVNGAFVFATFSQLYKVTPHMYAAWLNALRHAHVSARLWLLQFPQPAAASLSQHAAASGVRTARLLSARTAERSFHLARVSLADLFLDTTPYNGHTTTGDATWMGTPVLSLPSEMMQSRVAAGYSANAGCPQLNARSYREFELLAATMARRPATAAEMRACLSRQRWTSAAFDTQGWVASFDEGARMMWELHRYGLSPRHVLLPARHVPAVG